MAKPPLRTRLAMEPGNVVTFSVGLLFIAAAIFFYTSVGGFIENGREVTATVVDIVYETGAKKGRAHPVVRFRTADGKEITANSKEHRSVRPGESVQVVYDPRKPQEVELATIERLHRRRILISGFSALVGIAVCIMGVALDANTLRWRL